MSYEIIYEKQFIKIGEDLYLPLICAGSNNCYQQSFRTGREQRARDWNSIIILTDKSAVSEKEILNKFNYQIEEGTTIRLSNSGKFLSTKELYRFMTTAIKKAVYIEDFIRDNTLAVTMIAYDKNNELICTDRMYVHSVQEYLFVIEELKKQQKPNLKYHLQFDVNHGEEKVNRSNFNRKRSKGYWYIAFNSVKTIACGTEVFVTGIRRFGYSQKGKSLGIEFKLNGAKSFETLRDTNAFIKKIEENALLRKDQKLTAIFIKPVNTLVDDINRYNQDINNTDSVQKTIVLRDELNAKYDIDKRCPVCNSIMIPTIDANDNAQCLYCEKEFSTKDLK